MNAFFRSIAVPVVGMLISGLATAKQPTAPKDCASSDISGSFQFLACQGYEKKTHISGSPEALSLSNTQLTALGLSGTGGSWIEKIDGLAGTHTIDFTTALFGTVYFAVHKGAAGDFDQSTAWYKVEVTGVPLDTITFNYNGLSNAALYSVSPVSEPETFSLILAGLGVVGFMARRRRQQQP